jgi:hypothetical protein
MDPRGRFRVRPRTWNVVGFVSTQSEAIATATTKPTGIA